MIESVEQFRRKITIGQTRESIELDFKAILNTAEPIKTAIDIAAFSNRYGGCLLYGIKEEDLGFGRVASSISGVDDPEELHKRIDGIKRRNLPSDLVVQCHTIVIEDKALVSVVVQPMNSICFVRNENGYFFPIRNDFGNAYLNYDEVTKMYDNSSRKIFLKFRTLIGYEKEVSINPVISVSDGSPWKGVLTRARMVDNNSEIFELIIGANDLIRIPYSLVDEVWNAANAGEQIQIRLRSKLRWQGGAAHPHLLNYVFE